MRASCEQMFNKDFAALREVCGGSDITDITDITDSTDKTDKMGWG